MTTSLEFHKVIKAITQIANEITSGSNYLDDIDSKQMYQFAYNLEKLYIAAKNLAEVKEQLEEEQSKLNHPTRRGNFHKGEK